MDSVGLRFVILKFSNFKIQTEQTDLATFTVGQRRGVGGWGSWSWGWGWTKTSSGEMKHNLDMRASVNYVLINYSQAARYLIINELGKIIILTLNSSVSDPIAVMNKTALNLLRSVPHKT